MRGMLSIVVAATLVTTSLESLSAQTGRRQLPASMEIGDRVRFWTPEARNATRGILAAWTADSFAIGEAWYPVESVTRLQVRRGPVGDDVSSAAFIGGFIGAGVGLVFVAPCYLVGTCTDKDLREFWAMAGILTVVGAVAGALRKSRDTRWDDVLLHRLTLLPHRDGGLGIGVTVPF